MTGFIAGAAFGFLFGFLLVAAFAAAAEESDTDV